MVAPSNPRWLQWAFDTLVGLFDRVGLKTNVGKTVGMTCRPCPAAGNQSEETYGRLMMGEVLTYLERKRERVECRDCGKEMAMGSLDTHRMSQHGKTKERRWTWNDAATGGGRRRGANNISDRVPQGGDEGVSSGRLHGKGQDTDGDQGEFLATACQGRRDHLGGGKPPSSKMPTMQHSGPVVITKWTPQEHSDVQEWGGEEEAETGGGGGKRKHGDGLRGIRGTIKDVP